MVFNYFSEEMISRSTNTQSIIIQYRKKILRERILLINEYKYIAGRALCAPKTWSKTARG